MYMMLDLSYCIYLYTNSLTKIIRIYVDNHRQFFLFFGALLYPLAVSLSPLPFLGFVRNVYTLRGSHHAFAAIKVDGSIVTWGGDSDAIRGKL